MCDYLSMLGLKLNHVSKRGHRWVPTYADEIKVFIGMNILMALHSLPDLDTYWSMNDRLRVDGIAKIMQKHRYKTIKSLSMWRTKLLPILKGCPDCEHVIAHVSLPVQATSRDGWCWGHENIVRHTAHSIVSWPNPKQWLMIHTSDWMPMRDTATM